MIINFLIIVYALCADSVEYISNARKLQNNLTGGKEYKSDIRPSRNIDEAVEVHLDFTLTAVNFLDIKEQALNVNAFTTLKWQDPQLVWNSTAFAGIHDTAISPENIWTPDISLYNPTTSAHGEAKSKYKSKVRLNRNGTLKWISTSNWISSCSTDITWWPFDKQNCSLIFGSLSYDHRQIILKKGKNMKLARMLSNFTDRGEWTVTEMTSVIITKTYECCDYPFDTVKIDIKLQRIPLYYILYWILPQVSLILSFLLIFHLGKGQRSSYGVAILLSISINLSGMSSDLPHKSDKWPCIGITFISEFFLLCLALPLAQSTVHIAQRKRKPPPALIMTIVKFCKIKIRKHPVFSCLRCKGKGVENTEEAFETPVNNVANVEDEGAAGAPLVEDNTDSICNHDNNKQQWKAVGRFLDIVLSIVFLTLVILIPVIARTTLSKYSDGINNEIVGRGEWN